MYKINHMKKVIEDMNVFRNSLGLGKNLLMKYKQVFFLLKMSFKFPLKIIYLGKNKNKNHFG